MIKENKKYIDNEIDIIISWMNEMKSNDDYLDYQIDVEKIKSYIKNLDDIIDEFEEDEKNYNYESEE